VDFRYRRTIILVTRYDRGERSCTALRKSPTPSSYPPPPPTSPYPAAHPDPTSPPGFRSAPPAGGGRCWVWERRSAPREYRRGSAAFSLRPPGTRARAERAALVDLRSCYAFPAPMPRAVASLRAAAPAIAQGRRPGPSAQRAVAAPLSRRLQALMHRPWTAPQSTTRRTASLRRSRTYGEPPRYGPPPAPTASFPDRATMVVSAEIAAAWSNTWTPAGPCPSMHPRNRFSQQKIVDQTLPTALPV